MSARYDAVIVGGGHNGLVSAAYLARPACAALIVQRRDRVSGAVDTSELAPALVSRRWPPSTACSINKSATST
jgi:cation diffusion facilitator CzcD-associated flavoprotein CzcO